MPASRHFPASFAIASFAIAVGACAAEGETPQDQGADAAASDQIDAGSDRTDGANMRMDAGNADAVPAEADALFPYLQMGAYTDFMAEPATHPSAGPHGSVRSFFNPLLAASLTAGASVHPRGAAVIKELYSGPDLKGWAVMVKTGSGDTAADWYFYEILSVTNGANPVADGTGVPGCAGCHSAGVDFVRTTYP